MSDLGDGMSSTINCAKSFEAGPALQKLASTFEPNAIIIGAPGRSTACK